MLEGKRVFIGAGRGGFFFLWRVVCLVFGKFVDESVFYKVESGYKREINWNPSPLMELLANYTCDHSRLSPVILFYFILIKHRVKNIKTWPNHLILINYLHFKSSNR